MKKETKELWKRMLASIITIDEARELAGIYGLNPFYLVNPSSNQIFMSLMRNVFWKVFNNYDTLPDDWYAILKNEIYS